MLIFIIRFIVCCLACILLLCSSSKALLKGRGYDPDRAPALSYGISEPRKKGRSYGISDEKEKFTSQHNVLDKQKKQSRRKYYSQEYLPPFYEEIQQKHSKVTGT